ncbi:MAG TPA: hypothetical protein VK171_07290, partial [Fimbriimonas sp.]|nr:hypothetical protein [Fimbriimonas sp.]
AAKPANVFWVEIESGSGAGHGFTGSDGGEQEVKDLLAEKIAGYQTKYDGAVCRVVVTMK